MVGDLDLYPKSKLGQRKLEEVKYHALKLSHRVRSLYLSRGLYPRPVGRNHQQGTGCRLPSIHYEDNYPLQVFVHLQDRFRDLKMVANYVQGTVLETIDDTLPEGAYRHCILMKGPHPFLHCQVVFPSHTLLQVADLQIRIEEEEEHHYISGKVKQLVVVSW